MFLKHSFAHIKTSQFFGDSHNCDGLWEVVLVCENNGLEQLSADAQASRW